MVLADPSEQTVYYNPEYYGPWGYALVPALLTLFKRVALYGPVGRNVEKAERTFQHALSMNDFAGAIDQGLVIPVGYETFWDRPDTSPVTAAGVVSPHYPSEFDRKTDLDKSLNSGSLRDRRIVVPNAFKFEVAGNKRIPGPVAEYTRDFLESGAGLEGQERLKDRKFHGYHTELLNTRYRNFQTGHWQSPDYIIDVIGEDPSFERLIMANFYSDYLTDKDAMASAGGTIHLIAGTVALLQQVCMPPKENTPAYAPARVDRMSVMVAALAELMDGTDTAQRLTLKELSSLNEDRKALGESFRVDVEEALSATEPEAHIRALIAKRKTSVSRRPDNLQTAAAPFAIALRLLGFDILDAAGAALLLSSAKQLEKYKDKDGLIGSAARHLLKPAFSGTWWAHYLGRR